MSDKWWGYRHVEGTIQAKRYFAPIDIEEAEASPFVRVVVGPFFAKSREEALDIVKRSTEGDE